MAKREAADLLPSLLGGVQGEAESPLAFVLVRGPGSDGGEQPCDPVDGWRGTVRGSSTALFTILMLPVRTPLDTCLLSLQVPGSMPWLQTAHPPPTHSPLPRSASTPAATMCAEWQRTSCLPTTAASSLTGRCRSQPPAAACRRGSRCT